MKTDRFATSIFCDDIRQEIKQKFSLMGCYSGEMVFDKFPAKLAKLCIHTVFHSPIALPFERATIKVFMGKNRDEPLAEALLEANVLAQAHEEATKKTGATQIILNALISLGPVFVEGKSKIHVEIDTGDEIIDAGQILLRERPSGRKVPLAVKKQRPGKEPA